MVEITIQISDELAQRLEPLRSRLPELLSQLLNSANPSSASLAITTANLQEIPEAYLEVLDFLMTRPTPQDIVAFKVSPIAQERLRSLLDRNREGTLTNSEVAELDVYEQLEHLMILMKARAIASVG
ncbi:hypothetical protein H6F86_16680 [Phormidium sp. FACHB-592]|uniref:Uncharacterized protein n=1 Tax=Stenomitos frigidus AS-A4 TaxID=2933935 RepID=A0ABV0KPA7_9CYAN|nr:hypothetical protein [Phormidium sp. FACHB-592]MBD2075501.1 hypothetical protein [Phormidium sp. FACHB-592]